MAESTPMYTEDYQVKVLSYMLSNMSFRDIASEAVQDSHFANRALQWYFTTLKNAPHALTPTTLREELIKAAKTKTIKESEVDKVVSYYQQISKPPLPFEEQHIQDTFTNYRHVHLVVLVRLVLQDLHLLRQILN